METHANGPDSGRTLDLLVIEDDRADSQLIEYTLRRHGIAVRLEQVSSRAGLARALEAGRWDAVLFDHDVPGPDFAAALEEVRAWLPQVPVILVSGGVGEEQAIDLLKLGIDDFVLKDRLARLGPAIARCIEEYRQRRELKAAQDALRDSEARLRRTLEGGSVVAWELDLATGVLSEDGPVAALFDRPKGYRHGSLEDFLASVHPADRQPIHEAVTSVIRGGVEFDREFRAATRDGSTRWIGATGRVERDAAGTAVRIHGVAADITARKQADLAQQASEAFNRGLLQSLADGVFIAQDYRFVFANPALPALLGYQPDEFIGLPFERVIAPEFLATWVARFTQRVGPGEEPPKCYELQMLCKQAPRRRWVELRAGRIEFGQRPAVLGIIRDVGERKEAQDALADSEARANLILDMVPEAMLLVDSTGHIVRASARAGALFGYSVAQLQGRIVEDLMPQRFRARHDAFHRAFRNHPKERRMGENRQLTALHRDGSEFPIEVSLGPAQIGGEPHVIVTLVDTTERQRTTLELQRFAHIVNTSTDMKAFIDRDLKYQVINPAHAALFGKTPAEVAGRPVRDMFPAEMWRDIEPRLHAALAGEAVHYTSTRTFHDGSRHVLDTTYFPFCSHGETLGVVVRHHDVTARVAAETALARESARSQQLLRNSSDGIHILDRDGRVIEVSEAFCRMIGYTRDELIGASLALWDAKWEAVDLVGIVRQNVSRDGRNEFETRHRHRDGRLIDVEVSTQPIDLEGQRVLFCSSRDISQRRSAENALRESEMVLERAQQMAHVGSWTYGVADDRFIMSAECERILVWPGKSLDRADLLGLVHPDDVERMQAAWQHSLSTGAPYEIEHRLLIRGAIKHVDARGEVALDGQGRAHKMIGFTQDVTELRETERALAAHQAHLEELVATRTAELGTAEAKFRGLVEQSLAGIYILQDGCFRYVNPAFVALFGYDSPEEIVDRIAFPELVAPESRQLVSEQVGKRASGDIESKQYVFTGLRRDGTRIEVEVFGRTFDYQGRRAIIGLLLDVTQRRIAEQGQAAALAEAERLAQARSDFLANMSHEIRTPLNAVLGLAQIGARECGESRPRETFSRIVDSGQHLLRVVNDILDFSKIEAGKLVLEQTRFRLGEAIDRAIDMTAAQAFAKSLEYRVSEAPDLPESCVGDVLRLSQVLVNLLSNAVKFTERGHVGLDIACAGNTLRVGVGDSGIGMSANQIARLFGAFEQADSSTTRRFGGSGLGLAITKQLVELMGGSIGVSSAPGKGSRFEVRLPLVDPLQGAPLSPATIALAGLTQIENESLAHALRAHGLEVELRPVDQVFARHFDLALIDCRLLTSAGVTAIAAAIESGQRVGLACQPDSMPALAESLRDRVILFDRPLRLRRLIAALGSRATTASCQPVAQRLKGLRVLAAEDNDINRLVLGEILDFEGAQLVVAEDGLQMLERLAADGPAAYDVVFTDIQMPGIDGYETARRALALAPRLPIFGLTAHAMPDERDRCLAAGMVEHVAKPIDVDFLVAAVQRHVAFGQPPVQPPPATADAAPAGSVDWSRLERKFGGKRAFVDRLASTVVLGHTDTADKLRAAASAGDRDGAIFIAHTLKGMFGSLMASAPQELARRAEAAWREGADDAAALSLSLAMAIDDLVHAAMQRLQGECAKPWEAPRRRIALPRG